MPKDNIERAIAKGTRRRLRRRRVRERCSTRATGPAAWRCSSRRSPTTATARAPRCATSFTKTRRQPRRAGLGGMGLREEGRRRGGRPTATRRTTSIVAIDAGAEDVALDEDVYEVITAPEDSRPSARRWRPPSVEVESAELAMRPTSTRGGRRGSTVGAADAPDRDARGPRRRERGARELRRGRRGSRKGGGVDRVSEYPKSGKASTLSRY